MKELRSSIWRAGILNGRIPYHHAANEKALLENAISAMLKQNTKASFMDHMPTQALFLIFSASYPTSLLPSERAALRKACLAACWLAKYL
jgi:hypothetical protein